MRNPCQQLSQCRQLFRLMQAFLRLPQLIPSMMEFSDVGRNAADPVDLALCVAQGKNRVQDDDVAPARLVMVFARHGSSGGKKLTLCLPGHLDAVACIKGLGRQVGQVLLGQSVEIERPVVGHQVGAV